VRIPVPVLLITVACASASPKRAELLLLQRADALVQQGCYACLKDARAMYEQALSRRRPAVLVQRLFEVELLVGLREKELSLDSDTSFAHARGLARELGTPSAAQYLELAEAVPPDDIGTPIQERTLHIGQYREWTERGGEALMPIQAGAPTVISRYLAAAIRCGYGPRSPVAASDAPPAASRPPSDDPALILYRTAICFPINREVLEGLQNKVPRFSEIGYFLARVALQSVQADGGKRARELLTDAYAAFPTSTGISYLSGSLTQMSGDFRKALRFYDETLGRKPLHENALLGRTACLSFLGEADAAIATATRLIELHGANEGDAFYWRAWNRHERGELALARQDVERAKTLHFSSAVLTLAGMIEHDQDDLSPADADLTAAKELDAGNCVARWYLALVGLKREAWGGSAEHFAGAMACYSASALDTEHRKREMTARDDLDPAWQAAQLAGFDAAIKRDRDQESAAAYNAAINFLRAGDRSKAGSFADLAAQDPARAEKVDALRKLIVQTRKGGQ
jgi:hypothetical protein